MKVFETITDLIGGTPLLHLNNYSKEQGVDAVYVTQRGLALPLGVDDAIRTKLQEACAAAIEDPDFVAAMASLGQAISYMNAEEYTAYLAQAAVDVPAAMEAVGLL